MKQIYNLRRIPALRKLSPGAGAHTAQEPALQQEPALRRSPHDAGPRTAQDSRTSTL